MSSDRPPRSNDWLGDQLRQEAESTRPVFSPELHTRIREALDREQPVPTPLQLPRRSIGIKIAAGVSVAAAAVLAVWLVARPPVQTPQPAASASDFVAALALSRQLPQRVSGLLDTAVADGRWAYLDHDMQSAINALVQALPAELPIAGFYQKLADSPTAPE